MSAGSGAGGAVSTRTQAPTSTITHASETSEDTIQSRRLSREMRSERFWSGIDDAGGGLNSRFVVPHFPTWDPDTLAGSGKVMLGSYTPSTQGECDFCQDDPSALAPPREERRENIHRSREMQQFAAQLRDTKDPLEDLEPAERERKVAELRQKSCRRTNAVCNLCPHSSRYQTTLLAAMRNTSGYPRNWTRNRKGRRYLTPTSSTTCPARKSVASKS